MKPYNVTVFIAMIFQFISTLYLQLGKTNYLIYFLFLSSMFYILTFFIYFEELINKKK